MKVTRILHASVNVSGVLGDTDRFYTEVLGMDRAVRPEIPGIGGRWMAAGDGQVHLVDAAMAGRGIDPSGPHFCLAVEDFDQAVAELEGLGIPTVRGSQPDPHGGPEEVLQVWFTDPAGNTVELQQDRPL